MLANVHIAGEARSRDERKLIAQTEHMVSAFKAAAEEMGAQVEVEVTRGYDAFCWSPDDPFVQSLCATARQVGVEPVVDDGRGGYDCNIFNSHGIKAINIAVGYENAHSTAERLVIDDMEKAAKMLLAFVSVS